MALDLKDFSFVTVMDVEVFDEVVEDWSNVIPIDSETAPASGEYQAVTLLDSLTISNITQEGPEKEARGGIHSIPQVRFRKTVRLEMEDVVARLDAFPVLFGAKALAAGTGVGEGFAITDKFAKNISLRGKTFVVDKETGDRRWVEILFHNFLPDSVFDMTMEAEGDIGMINVAGELFPNYCGEYFEVRRIANEECPTEDPST